MEGTYGYLDWIDGGHEVQRLEHDVIRDVTFRKRFSSVQKRKFHFSEILLLVQHGSAVHLLSICDMTCSADLS